MIIKISIATAIITSTMMTGLFAQDEYKVEFSPYIGFTFSEGVDTNGNDIGDDQIVREISPISGSTYGLTLDVMVSENFSVGFNYSEQDSALEGQIEGAGKIEFTDMKVKNYHGIFTYHWGWEDDRMRPFVFGGVGATQYSPDDVMGFAIDGDTKFSTTWGGGIKLYPIERIGFKFTGRWTPTYIKTDADGIYCSPYWGGGCWVVGEPDYSNQLELSAGVTFRF